MAFGMVKYLLKWVLFLVGNSPRNQHRNGFSLKGHYWCRGCSLSSVRGVGGTSPKIVIVTGKFGLNSLHGGGVHPTVVQIAYLTPYNNGKSSLKGSFKRRDDSMCGY
ncbi:hypothetical protein OIU74_010982 [Salix koriyanagi]|uniref:Uncharacterized protein n=1 Tax=Salix koriyanagi TaxID=2511006 RepID=A0A9Q0TE61_9ROSI|nr:hypothetical protein OIU74_010982 [Salix koriyanagi]